MNYRVQIPPKLVSLIEPHRPEWKSESEFCADLIYQGLLRLRNPIRMETDPALGNNNNSINNGPVIPQDNGSCLPAQQPTLVIHDTNGQVVSSKGTSQLIKKSTKNEYTEAFNAFWKLYLKAPRVVNQPTKHKGYQEWKKALSIETGERLIEALRRAIKEQNKLIHNDQFCSPLPDPFRWLRDRRYEPYLADPSEDSEFTPDEDLTYTAPKFEQGVHNPYAVFEAPVWPQPTRK